MKKGRISFVFIIAFLSIIQSAAAGPTVYIPLGSGNQVIAVDAATDTITASFSGVINSHGLVATPDGEYLIAGSLKEEPLANDQPKKFGKQPAVSDTPGAWACYVYDSRGRLDASPGNNPGWQICDFHSWHAGQHQRRRC